MVVHVRKCVDAIGMLDPGQPEDNKAQRQIALLEQWVEAISAGDAERANEIIGQLDKLNNEAG